MQNPEPVLILGLRIKGDEDTMVCFLKRKKKTHKRKESLGDEMAHVTDHFFKGQTQLLF